MKTASRLALGAATLALAITPSLATAKSNHGLHCGRGHAKHTKAIGKKCDKSSKHHNAGTNNGSTGPTGPAGPNGQKRGATDPDGSSGTHRENGHTAAAQCRSEQASDPAGFKAKYGTGRDAFGRCVEDHTPSG